MTRRPALIALLLAVVLVGAGLVSYALVSGDDEAALPKATGETGPDGLRPFYTQTVKWSDCGDGRCADVKVPIDYDKPEGETTTVRVKDIPAEGKGGRYLFVNPGGPGGVATTFADYLHGQLPDAVLDEYDIVGVDPRGVGASDPLKCFGDRRFDDFAASDPTPDDAAEIEAFRSDYTELGKACERKDGELAAHVSTEEAARDLDVVRALMGSTTFDWFGASYGTQLGATYATLFPEKVGRMVLDGAVDPSLSAEDGALGQATGFGRAIRAYVEDCVQKSSCPLGRDPDVALQRLSDLLASADASPLRTGEDRKLTEGLMFYGVAVTLYDKKTWPVLTQALQLGLQRNGSLFLKLADAYFQRGSDGHFASNIGESIYAVSCLDTEDHSTVAEVKASIPRFEKVSPVFGKALAWGVLGCASWPIKPTHPQIPIDASGSEPILVLGTTRDPATPYEWAKALTAQLKTGVLVTREGDGHTAYAAGNECINEKVDAYLVSGKVPKDGTVCKA
ncbi:alpha/beta hydrolase [Aeromicrobium terrae]|uniref:alpha/beta hydrolase n=1 Tax=Aeromicrobium terrae TaxID=2498846 RepID=UPI00164F804F|nr:alpha/beta hydrolase [Aeromicrobium terrae]